MSLNIPTLPDPYLPSGTTQKTEILTKQVNNNINIVQTYFNNLRYIIQDKLANYQTSSNNMLDLYSVYQNIIQNMMKKLEIHLTQLKLTTEKHIIKIKV